VAAGDIPRLKRGYQAFNEGGVEAVLDWLAPEIEVSDRQSVPDRMTHHGLSGMKDLVDSAMEAFGELRLEPEEFLEVGSDRVLVVLRQHARGRASGVQVEGQVAHLWTMERGTPVQLKIYRDRETALDVIAKAAGRPPSDG
jgi:ketosteroid isomerase-like protein